MKKAVTASQATTHSQSSYQIGRCLNRRARKRSITALVARMYVMKAAAYSEGRWLCERNEGDRPAFDGRVVILCRSVPKDTAHGRLVTWLRGALDLPTRSASESHSEIQHGVERIDVCSSEDYIDCFGMGGSSFGTALSSRLYRSSAHVPRS